MSEWEENPDREQQLDAIIAEYYCLVEKGEAPNHRDFTSRYQDFQKELNEFFADLRMFQQSGRSDSEDPALEPTIEDSASLRKNLSVGTVVRYFGVYEILEELGSGGMGVVYKARHARLKKLVALKMIRAAEFATDFEVKMFQAEARAAAKLDHPGIVPVHEVGIHGGQHFYAMDYVAGGSLSKLHREEPVMSRRAAELVRQMAEAIHYAHGKGIVHRDLKPANVLLTPSGVPRITDFGLAKRMWADQDSVVVRVTETGQVLGTAGYMSPEQAEGKPKLVGPPADVYALGAVLYALLTSRAPFVGESQAHIIAQVIRSEPVSPRVLNPSVPRDLETICLKCLNKLSHGRYGTAQLLADDLQRFLEARPVLARPVSRPSRAWRWCRRNPIVATLWTSVAVLLFIVGIGGSIGTIEFRKLYEHEQKLRKESDIEYIGHLFDLSTTQAEREPIIGLASLAKALTKAKGKDVPELDSRIRLHLNAWLRDYSPPIALRQEQIGVRFEISPDSKTVLSITAGPRRKSGEGEQASWDLQTVDIATGQLLWRRSGRGHIDSATYRPDGKHILTVQFVFPDDTPQGDPVQAIVETRLASTGKVVDLISDSTYIHGAGVHGPVHAQYSPNGRSVLIYGGQQGVRIWNCETRSFGPPLAMDERIRSAILSPSGSFLVTQSQPVASKRLDQITTRVFRSPQWTLEDAAWVNARNLRAISFSNDERYVCTETDQQLSVFDRISKVDLPSQYLIPPGKQLMAMFGADPPQMTVVEFQDSLGGTAVSWNPNTGKRLPFDRAMGSRTGYLPRVIPIENPFEFTGQGQVLANGRHFASNGNDWKILQICGMTTGVPQGRSFLLHDRPQLKISCRSMAQGGIILAIPEHELKGPFQNSTGDAGYLFFWGIRTTEYKDGRSAKVRQELQAKSPTVDLQLNSVECLNRPQISPFTKLQISVRLDQSLSCSIDKTMVAVGQGEEGLIVFEAGEVKTLTGLSERTRRFVDAVRFSPQGNVLAIGGRNGLPIYLYDNRTAAVQELENGRGWISSLAFRQDGQAIVAGSYRSERQVRLWSLPEGKLEHEWDVPSDVFAVDYSPTDKAVAGGTENSRLFVWSPTSGELLWSGEHKRGSPINSLRFSPDGKLIATAATNGSVQLWETATGKKLGPVLTDVLMKEADCTGAVSFSASGKEVYFITAEGKLWEWSTPSPIQGDADTILDYVELSTNLKLDQADDPILLTPSESLERSARVGTFAP